jgi:hypothetical protein
VFHPPGDVKGKEKRLFNGYGLAGKKPTTQRGIGFVLGCSDEFKDEIDLQANTRLDDFMTTHDMGMTTQFNPGRSLPQETVSGTTIGKVFRFESLECNRTSLLCTVIDNTHAPN